MSDKKLWDYHQNENRIHLKEGYFRQNLIFNKVTKFIKKGGTILEIGFGDGYLLNKLSDYGFKTYGQDFSESNIQKTKEQWNNYKIDFLVGNDSGKILMEDNSVDCFIASEVLEHMNDNELNICVNEIYRILRKDGYALITFPYKENLERFTSFCPNCGTNFHKWGHKQSWNKEKIINLFDNFDIIKIDRFISLGTKHYNNIFIRYTCLLLNKVFCIKQDLLQFISSNYFLILKKK